MENLFFQILVEFGLPVASATVMGVFIYIILKYILDSVIGHDMIKLDVQISSALDLRQDEDRLARADGKTDARKD